MSKKSKKSKMDELYRVEQEMEQEMAFLNTIMAVMAITGLVLLCTNIVIDSQRGNPADLKVQSNVRAAVTGTQEWTGGFPDTAVPMVTVSGSSDGRQERHVYWATAQDEKSLIPVPVFAEPGNVVTVKPGTRTGSYTICAYSAGGERASSAASAVVYDSSTRETKTGVPCP